MSSTLKTPRETPLLRRASCLLSAIPSPFIHHRASLSLDHHRFPEHSGWPQWHQMEELSRPQRIQIIVETTLSVHTSAGEYYPQNQNQNQEEEKLATRTLRCESRSILDNHTLSDHLNSPLSEMSESACFSSPRSSHSYFSSPSMEGQSESTSTCYGQTQNYAEGKEDAVTIYSCTKQDYDIVEENLDSNETEEEEEGGKENFSAWIKFETPMDILRTDATPTRATGSRTVIVTTENNSNDNQAGPSSSNKNINTNTKDHSRVSFADESFSFLSSSGFFNKSSLGLPPSPLHLHRKSSKDLSIRKRISQSFKESSLWKSSKH